MLKKAKDHQHEKKGLQNKTWLNLMNILPICSELWIQHTDAITAAVALPVASNQTFIPAKKKPQVLLHTHTGSKELL